MSDPKVQAVADAWNDPGPCPRFHEFAKAKLRKEWPVLARAVEKLAREVGA